jgi:hypothetical protein
MRVVGEPGLLLPVPLATTPPRFVPCGAFSEPVALCFRPGCVRVPFRNP